MQRGEAGFDLNLAAVYTNQQAVRSRTSKCKNSECIVFRGQLTGQFSPESSAFAFLLVVIMKRGIKLVHGVGLNDADYSVTSPKRCAVYTKWCDMLMRCYSKKYQMKNPKYIGCVVCDEWFIFSNFKKWVGDRDLSGLELDKDLMGNGRIYSPETCCFVTRQVNSFLVGTSRSGSLGSSWHKGANKFMCVCRNPFTKKSENLGLYKTMKEANSAWWRRKREHAINLAIIQGDSLVASAILKRYDLLPTK